MYTFFSFTDVEPNSIFYSFSFISSCKELLNFNKNNEYNFMNGFKVVVMIGILLGHNSMFYMGNPISHSKNLEYVSK